MHDIIKKVIVPYSIEPKLCREWVTKGFSSSLHFWNAESKQKTPTFYRMILLLTSLFLLVSNGTKSTGAVANRKLLYTVIILTKISKLKTTITQTVASMEENTSKKGYQSLKTRLCFLSRETMVILNIFQTENPTSSACESHHWAPQNDQKLLRFIAFSLSQFLSAHCSLT